MGLFTAPCNLSSTEDKEEAERERFDDERGRDAAKITGAEIGADRTP